MCSGSTVHYVCVCLYCAYGFMVQHVCRDRVGHLDVAWLCYRVCLDYFLCLNGAMSVRQYTDFVTATGGMFCRDMDFYNEVITVINVLVYKNECALLWQY